MRTTRSVIMVAFATAALSGCAAMTEVDIGAQNAAVRLGAQRADVEIYASDNASRVAEAAVKGHFRSILPLGNGSKATEAGSPSEPDCGNDNERFAELCDKTFGSGDLGEDLEEVCKEWRAALDSDTESCQDGFVDHGDTETVPAVGQPVISISFIGSSGNFQVNSPGAAQEVGKAQRRAVVMPESLTGKAIDAVAGLGGAFIRGGAWLAVINTLGDVLSAPNVSDSGNIDYADNSVETTTVPAMEQ